MFNGFRGAMAEQFYWTNWGSWGGRYHTPSYHRQKGNMAPFTAIWCISVLLQAAPDVAREFGPLDGGEGTGMCETSPGNDAIKEKPR
jgi:hypothetical protein